jgi:hypothetical protein
MNEEKLKKLNEEIRREQERNRQRELVWKRINEQKKGGSQNKIDDTPKNYGRTTDERPTK